MTRKAVVTRLPKLSLVALAVLAGCATPTDGPIEQSQRLANQGRWEESLQVLEQERRNDSRSVPLHAALLGTRALAIQEILRQADADRERGHDSTAHSGYDRALHLEPGNPRAKAGLDALANKRRRKETLDTVQEQMKRGNLEAAEKTLRPVLLEAPQNLRAMALTEALDERRLKRPAGQPPELEFTSTQPISLEFRDANLRMVLDAFSRASGINFVFDRDIKSDAKATVLLKNATIKEAIDSLLLTNQLEKKVLNANTLFIYPSSAQKQKDYQDLVIRNFYLANADAKQTMTMLKTIIKAKDIFIDEKRNTLVMRDTPEAIALAEKLIAAHDQAEPEVMLMVDVIEVKRAHLAELGLQFPSQIKFSAVGASNTTGTTTTTQPLTIKSAKGLPSSVVNVSGLDPLLAINLSKVLSEGNLLANPRIRVRNREKAKIHVGDRVPYSTTTTSATTSLVSQNVTYIDVGLKLEVEPQIFLDDDVMIKVALEVSSVVKDVPIGNNQTVPQVGTRNASTTLSLKSGETQILAGLIRNEDKLTTTKLPGLGDIPLIGRLFSSEGSDSEKTEILLSITPLIVRNLERPAVNLIEYYSGPDSQAKTFGGGQATIQKVDAGGTATTAGGGGLMLPVTPPPATLAPATPLTSVAPGIPIVPSVPVAPAGGVQGSPASSLTSGNSTVSNTSPATVPATGLANPSVPQGQTTTLPTIEEFEAPPGFGSGAAPVPVPSLTP